MCMIKSPFLGPARANFTGQNLINATWYPPNSSLRATLSGQHSTGSATIASISGKGPYGGDDFSDVPGLSSLVWPSM